MSDRPQHEIPYLHVRAPRRVVGVGGEGEPLAKVLGNGARLLRLREQVEVALRADEGMAASDIYREPDRPDYSTFAERPGARTRPIGSGPSDVPRTSAVGGSANFARTGF